MIYTTGYLSYTLSSFTSIVSHLSATIADIRYSPYSRNPTWGKSNLQKLFPDYVHMFEFGNADYKTGGIRFVDYEKGLRQLQSIDGNVILLCACKSPVECHRTELAKKLRLDGLAVKELEPSDYTRISVKIDQPSFF